MIATDVVAAVCAAVLFIAACLGRLHFRRVRRIQSISAQLMI